MSNMDKELIEACQYGCKGDWHKFLEALRDSLKHPHHWKQRRRIQDDIKQIEQFLKDSNDSGH